MADRPGLVAGMDCAVSGVSGGGPSRRSRSRSSA